MGDEFQLGDRTWSASTACGLSPRNTGHIYRRRKIDEDGWVKIADRAPSLLTDFPIELYDGIRVWIVTTVHEFQISECATHWKRYKSSAPPAPEIDYDREAFKAWINLKQWTKSQDDIAKEAWNAALTYARKEKQ